MPDDSAIPRVAVVGSGYWGKNHVRTFQRLGALKVVCDKDTQRLDALRAEYGSSFETITSFADVLTDPSVDAVVLATPAATHAPLAEEALLAGKDVLVEKPLALSVPDGERLVELAQAKDRILMVGHLLWYHPAIEETARMVTEGELGQVRYIYSNRLNFGKFRTEENILWSFAPHDISVILGLLDEMPSQVHADGASYLSSKVADVTVSTLGFPSGTRAHVFVSWLHPFKEQRLVVIGDLMTVTFEDGPGGGRLNRHRHSIEWSDPGRQPARGEAERVGFEAREPLLTECEHFLDCLRTRRPPRTDGREGLRVLTVLSQCERSLQENA